LNDDSPNVDPPSNLFEKVLSFSQPNFQPTSTHKFVMDWAVSHFIFERLNITSFLSDHQTLGAHTDIIQYQPGMTTTFRWTHPGSRPFGFGVSKQCPQEDCKRLKTRSRKGSSTADCISLQCSQCKHKVSFHLDPTWTWCDGKDGEVAWLFKTEKDKKSKESKRKELNANKMDVDMA